MSTHPGGLPRRSPPPAGAPQPGPGHVSLPGRPVSGSGGDPAGGPQVITAGPADLDALSQVIADAFHDLAQSEWLLAAPEDRRKIFPGYFRLYLEHALGSGIAHTTPDRDAAALWIPAGPGTAGLAADHAVRLAAVTGSRASRFLAFDAALDQRHPADTAHHHLAILAVRPGRQGSGIGTALLRAHHQALDHDGTAAYLEAASLRTRSIYLRHGYADYGPPFSLPAGGPAMWPMWREPPGKAVP